jgi:hypothetical protein
LIHQGHTPRNGEKRGGSVERERGEIALAHGVFQQPVNGRTRENPVGLGSNLELHLNLEPTQPWDGYEQGMAMKMIIIA